MRLLRNWWIGLLISLVAAVLLELTGYWQTMLVAGLLGGLWVGGSRRGFLAGALGTLLAWGGYLAYFALTDPLLELSQIFMGIAGVEGNGTAFIPIALALLVTFLLGGAGGWLGGVLIPTVPNAT